MALGKESVYKTLTILGATVGIDISTLLGTFNANCKDEAFFLFCMTYGRYGYSNRSRLLITNDVYLCD
jgi:hypothetical protein